jgi:transcription termination factor NusA
MTEPSESPAAMFQRTLHIGADLANALERGGLTTLDEVAYIPHWELAEIGTLDEVQTQRLREMARMYLLNESLDGFDAPPSDLLGDEPPERY